MERWARADGDFKHFESKQRNIDPTVPYNQTDIRAVK
jgi:hypothetical protein